MFLTVKHNIPTGIFPTPSRALNFGRGTWPAHTRERAPPYNKRFSICDTVLFSETNKTLSSYLKQLVKNGKIAATVHKVSLTADIIKKLYGKRELADVDTQSPRALLQTAWFQISISFGKRGRENQSSLKKSMLRLVKTADGQEYFELKSHGRSRWFRRSLRR
jgi:hypothetical protein